MWSISKGKCTDHSLGFEEGQQDRVENGPEKKVFSAALGVSDGLTQRHPALGSPFPGSGPTSPGGQPRGKLALLHASVRTAMGNCWFGSTLSSLRDTRDPGAASSLAKLSDQNRSHFPFPLFPAESAGLSAGCVRLNSHI